MSKAIHLNAEERSELRAACRFYAPDRYTSAETRRVLQGAYGKLAAADGLPTKLTVGASPRDIAEPLRSIGEVAGALIGKLPDEEAEAVATAAAGLGDRLAVGGRS